MSRLTDPRWGVSSWGEEPAAWIFELGERGGTGFFAHEEDELADLVVRLADAVQDEVVESRHHFGVAFPPCPRHMHPLVPILRQGSAVWVCNRDSNIAIEIGALTGR